MKTGKGKGAVRKETKEELRPTADNKVGKKRAATGPDKSSKVKDKKVKGAKKDPNNNPQRPPSAFLVFLEEFRKAFKNENRNVKAVSAVDKAGGEKWKSMSPAEKAPYEALAAKEKAQYDKLIHAYDKNQESSADEGDEESERSKSEISDDEEESGQVQRHDPRIESAQSGHMDERKIVTEPSIAPLKKRPKSPEKMCYWIKDSDDDAYTRSLKVNHLITEESNKEDLEKDPSPEAYPEYSSMTKSLPTVPENEYQQVRARLDLVECRIEELERREIHFHHLLTRVERRVAAAEARAARAVARVAQVEEQVRAVSHEVDSMVQADNARYRALVMRVEEVISSVIRLLKHM